MNRDFIYTVPEKIFNDKTLSINDLKMYMIVRSFMDTTGDAYPSNNWIAKRLDIDRVTAIRCINKLCEKGYMIRKNIDGNRHLTIANKSMPEVVASTPPPSGTDATPPSGVDATQLIQSSITSNSITSKRAKQSVDNSETKRRRPQSAARTSVCLTGFPEDFLPDENGTKLLYETASKVNMPFMELLSKFKEVHKKYKTKCKDWQVKFIEFLKSEKPKRVYEDSNGSLRRYDGLARY